MEFKRAQVRSQPLQCNEQIINTYILLPDYFIFVSGQRQIVTRLLYSKNFYDVISLWTINNYNVG